MSDELPSSASPVPARGMVLIAVVALAAAVAGGAIDRVWTARAVTSATELLARTDRRGARSGVPSERGIQERELIGDGQGIPVSLRSLSLTDSQRVRIEKITAHYRPAADSVMRDFRPIADSILRMLSARVATIDLQMRQEAMCVLTPQQREEWIAWRRREHVVVEDNDLMSKLVITNTCPREPR